MRLGISSWAYPWSVAASTAVGRAPMSVTDLLVRASDLGVGVVQVADNLAPELLSDEEVRAVRETARRRDLELEVGTRGLGPHVARVLGVAEAWGARFVRLVVDSPGDHPTPDEAVRRMMPWRAGFEAAGVLLALENHDRWPSPVLAQVVEDLGPWAGVCVDLANSIGCLESPADTVRTLAPLAVNVHVKDVEVRRRADNQGFEIRGCAVGSGALDVAALIAHLAATSPARTAVLEAWVPATGSVAARLQQESSWARTSVTWLRDHTPLT